MFQIIESENMKTYKNSWFQGKQSNLKRRQIDRCVQSIDD